MSYHVRGKCFGSGEKYSSSHILEILTNLTKLSKLVHIKRNSWSVALKKTLPNLVTLKILLFQNQKHLLNIITQPRRLFHSFSNKKVRHIIESDSDCNAEVTPSVRRKASATSEESDAIVPKQHRTPIVWEQKRKQHQTSKVEDTDEEVITKM
jgi:hypothetical protein